MRAFPVQEKWKLLPAFLRMKGAFDEGAPSPPHLLLPALRRPLAAATGLVRQHIESFNYFINVDIKKIVKANELVNPWPRPPHSCSLFAGPALTARSEQITSDHDAAFYLKYTDVRINEPTLVESAFVDKQTTPMQVCARHRLAGC
jgi:DNA-directed RNA polymerase III subunit RPC2